MICLPSLDHLRNSAFSGLKDDIILSFKMLSNLGRHLSIISCHSSEMYINKKYSDNMVLAFFKLSIGSNFMFILNWISDLSDINKLFIINGVNAKERYYRVAATNFFQIWYHRIIFIDVIILWPMSS